MTSIRLEIEYHDEVVEFKNETSFTWGPWADGIQTARQMLERVTADAEAWLAARDRPQVAHRPIRDNPQA